VDRPSIRLKGDNTLVVILAYHTCNQSNATIDAAVNTVNHQQKLMLHDDQEGEENPRTQFIHDLIALIQEIEKDKKTAIILMMLANEAISDAKGSLKRIFRETSLINAFPIFTKTEFNIPTHTRGKNDWIIYLRPKTYYGTIY
jgi:hypothetical protein